MLPRNETNLLAQKDARLADLEKDLVESQERLSLVQRIIKEKDDHVLMLEEEMAGIENKLEGHDELTRSTVDNLTEQAQGSAVKINDLQKQFTELAAKYKQSEKEMKTRDNKIRDLQKALNKKSSTLANYKKAFMSKDQQLMELNGVVQIYKSKLIEASSDLKSKDKELDRLEKQMDDLDLRLQDVKLDEPEKRGAQDQVSREHTLQTEKLGFPGLAQAIQ